MIVSYEVWTNKFSRFSQALLRFDNFNNGFQTKVTSDTQNPLLNLPSLSQASGTFFRWIRMKISKMYFSTLH